MNTYKNLTLAVAASATLALGSCSQSNGEQKIDQATAKVEAIAVKETLGQKEYSFSGLIVSEDQTIISTKLLGQIKRVLVKEGQKVSRGELLVEVASKELESKLASAKAGLQQAQANLDNTAKNHERIKALFDQGSATQKEWDDINTALTAAKSQAETARRSIDEIQELMTYAKLRAPISGFVSQKFKNEGDLATPGQPLLALESMQQLKADLMVPETEIALFHTGDTVSLNFSSMSGAVYQAIVDRIVPSTVYSGAQFQVSATMIDADAKVLPGMHTSATINRASESQIWLPASGIVKRGQLTGVYTVSKDQEALLRWVRLGRSFDNQYLVLSGVEAGEQVIIHADQSLKDGVRVSLNQVSK